MEREISEGVEALIALVVALAIFGGLSACATTKPTAPPPPPAVVARLQCLPMVSYSKAEQTQAADELAKLPAGSMVGRLVTDYGAMRAADRACQAQP